MTNSIGQILREARLRKRLSLADCGRLTHIATRFLDALEDDRWNELPSESHRLGFLRLYAKSLDVWSDELLAMYRSRTSPPETPKFQGAPPMNGLRPSRPSLSWSMGSWQLVSLLAVCFLVLAWGLYRGIRHHQFEDRYISWVRLHKKVFRR